MRRQDGRPSLLLLAPSQNQRVSNVPTVKHAELKTLDGVMALFGPLASNLITHRLPSVSNFLEGYEDVATRIRRVHDNYPLCRFNIRDLAIDFDKGYVYAVTEVYRDANDEHPAAVDVAFEARSDRGVNRDFWVENCITSSYGRSAGLLLGSEKRSTKQDMEKVERLNNGKVDSEWSGFSVKTTSTTIPDPLGTALELVKDQLGGSELEEAPICNHGHMIFKTGLAKATNKEWRGYMCTERVKAKQCNPVWQKQTNTGSWYTPKPELADHL
jgi:hypothetical protein